MFSFYVGNETVLQKRYFSLSWLLRLGCSDAASSGLCAGNCVVFAFKFGYVQEVCESNGGSLPLFLFLRVGEYLCCSIRSLLFGENVQDACR